MELFSAFKSVMAAMLGVQNSKNHREDFSKKSATPFIVVGIVMTVLFVLGVYTFVKLLISMS